MRIDITLSLSPAVEQVLLGQQQELLKALKRMENRIMISLTTLQEAVTSQRTVIDGAVALIDGLQDQIANLAPTQAAIDELAASVAASRDALANAMLENTPAPPPEEPPVE